MKTLTSFDTEHGFYIIGKKLTLLHKNLTLGCYYIAARDLERKKKQKNHTPHVRQFFSTESIFHNNKNCGLKINLFILYILKH